MQDPNSLRTYLPPRQFLHEYYCLFRLLSPEFDSGDSDCRGFSFRRWPTSCLSLTRRPSCFYRLSSILSKSFCKWTMFKNFAVCVVHDPPDFRRSFFFQIQITRMQIHQYSIYEYLECIDLKTSTDAWFQICLLAFMLPFIFPLIWNIWDLFFNPQKRL